MSLIFHARCYLYKFNVYINKKSSIFSVFAFRVAYERNLLKLKKALDCFTFQTHSPVNNLIDMLTSDLNEWTGLIFFLGLLRLVWFDRRNTTQLLQLPAFWTGNFYSGHTHSIEYTSPVRPGNKTLIYFKKRFFIKGHVD